jgi:hypothetical protein
MSELDNLIVGFKDSMSKAGQYAKGDDQTDVATPNGPVPSIAKQARLAAERIDQLVPDLSNRLRLDGDGGYDNNQKAWGRANLNLDKVENLAPSELPLSIAVQGAIETLIAQIDGRETPANRNKVGGYFGYEGAKLPIRNGADSIFSYLFHNHNVSRMIELPDGDGVLALKSDIKGINSNTNTGDETTATIRAKLNITVLSGDNTGDETKTSILSKLQIPSISGVNAGDETRESIVAKVGYEIMPLGARNALNGVAPLDANRLVPTENLPAAFESVVTVANYGVIPQPGVQKRIYIAEDNGGVYYWNGTNYNLLNVVLNSTNQLAEGNLNLYFTQLRSISSVLAGYAVGSNSAVAAADTVLLAIGKIQGQLNAAFAELTNLALIKENLSNKATSFATINNTLYPTTQAVRSYLDTRLTGVLNDRGSWDASSNAWPTTGGSSPTGSIQKGNLWFVSVVGLLGGVAVNVGDSFRALVDDPGQVASNWDVLESNIGYVPYNATNPLGFTSNQTDAYLVARSSHTGTQSALTIDETVGRVFVTAGEKVAITHANRAALDLVSGTNTGDENQSTILGKLGSSPLTLNVNGSVKFNDAANTNATYYISFGDGINSQTALKADTELNYNPSTNTLAAGTFSGGRLVTTGTAASAQATAGLGMVASDTTRGATVVGNGSAADVSLADRNLVTRLAVTIKGVNVVGTFDVARGADLASIAALNLTNATGNVVDVTGTTNITSIVLTDGAERLVRFSGILTLTNSVNLVLPTGLDIKTAAGDYATFVGRPGGVVHCVSYNRATGAPLVGGLLDKSRSITANTAATAVDLNTGDQAVVFKVAVAANTTVTFSNPPTPTNGELFSFTLITTNDGTAGRGLAFGNTIKWAGGFLPPRTTTANAIDVWTFFVDNGVYFGSLAVADAK